MAQESAPSPGTVATNLRVGDEAATDDDGSNYDVQVWARCEMTVRGESIVFDFSKSDKQVRFVNCPLSATYASVYSAVFTSLPAEISSYHNEGSYRAIGLIAPPGSCVNPVYPATVAAAIERGVIEEAMPLAEAADRKSTRLNSSHRT